jgi:hypothetical protein
MHLYVALHDRNFPGGYHWALVPSDSAMAPDGGVVTIRQIQNPGGPYKPVYLTGDLTSFMGCSGSLPLALSSQEIVDFIN